MYLFMCLNCGIRRLIIYLMKYYADMFRENINERASVVGVERKLADEHN